MENEKQLKKYAFDGLYIELTRRCNLQCAHCMCGSPQNVDISEEIIDTLLSQTFGITQLSLGGGEPLLAIDKLEYLLNALERHQVPVRHLDFVTNGTICDSRVTQLINDYLERNSLTHCAVCVSSDVFHDIERSKKCVEFYKQFVSPNCEVKLHRDFKTLHYSGRAWGKKSINGIPVGSRSENSIRQHRINVTDGHFVCCAMRLSVNGDLALGGDLSYEVADKLSLGNLKKNSLKDIFEKNFRECACLCDECYKECYIQSYEDFGHKSTTITDDINLLMGRINRKHLEFIWKLREWAFKAMPQVDPRAIVMGTIITDADFTEYVNQYCIRYYRALYKLKSDEEASSRFSLIACTEHQKAIKKKFPTATQNEIYELSALKVLFGAINNMTLDDFKRALFNGNPAEGYFSTIEKRLKDHGEDFEAFDPCSKIPDTLDPDKEGDTDVNPNEELQPDTDG